MTPLPWAQPAGPVSLSKDSKEYSEHLPGHDRPVDVLLKRISPPGKQDGSNRQVAVSAMMLTADNKDKQDETLPIPHAVIDVGTSSLRMTIAETVDGRPRVVDELQQAVTLGRESFTTGSILPETVERCVEVLSSFRDVLRQYQIPLDRSHVRVVATNAVREAGNQEAFIDRIYIGTGFEVEVLDDAEVNRFTYLSVLPIQEHNAFAQGADLLVVEVGGGHTDVLGLAGGRVVTAESHRIGSLRMRQVLEDHGSEYGEMRDVMESQIARMVGAVSRIFGEDRRIQLVARGGDVRTAAAQLIPGWSGMEVAPVSLNALTSFTEQTLNTSVDELVRRYQLSFPDAETLGPALLTYVRIAGAFALREILVVRGSMRDGILTEMVGSHPWTVAFREQLIASAIGIGDKYDVDRQHTDHVTHLSRELFAALQSRHLLGTRYEVLLTLAALLHDIGSFVSNRSHHKHSMYLIENSDIFGMGSRDKLITALIARYHRRSIPMAMHEGYELLDREDRMAVAKLAAILRIADALDRSHEQRVKNIDITIQGRDLVIRIPGLHDLAVERLALEQKGEMFSQIYGLDVVLVPEGWRS